MSVTDNIEVKTINASYITKTHNFGEIEFYKGYFENDIPVIESKYSDTISIKTGVENGLLLVCNYTVNVNANVTYNVQTNISGSTPFEGNLSDNSGKIVYEIIKKGDSS